MSQHRLRRVQVVNWGTFGGEWSFAVPWKGMLLTGPSGAGKSSLLDAMAALLVPPGRMRFNAAAQGTDTGDRERSLLTYVRGAHKRETDEETGEVGTAFLRRGPTWSAVALTYADSAGTVSTLVRLFHIRASSTDPRDLKSMYILAPEPVDVLTLKSYVENGIENRRVSAAFPHWDCYSADAYTAFSTKFRRVLGMGSQQAQILLHKTQSAKNLTNLDNLFRDFMLDLPETFKLSDATVEQFEELRLAHASVVDARRQVETLTPLRAVDAQLRALDAERTALAAEEEYLGTWVLVRRLTGARAELDREAPVLERLAAEVRIAETALDEAADEVRRTERAVEQSGGARVGALEELRTALQSSRDQRNSRAEEYAAAAAELGLAFPGDAVEAVSFGGRLQERASGLAADRARQRAGQFDLLTRKGDLVRKRDGLDEELTALRRHRSNLDARLLHVRERLAGLLHVEETRLPFVGELIQVKADEAGWTGAIERVLGSLARTLVIPEQHYLAAAEFIDGEFLGTRLVYERVRAAEPVAAEVSAPGGSLVAKVDIAEGPFAGWLADRLMRRYDYACVPSPAGFAGVERAVTRQGQVKHSAALHEKDDRRRVEDRSRWVLGFSTEAKEAELVERLGVAERELAEVEQRLTELDEGERRLRGLEAALGRLAGFAWDSVDAAPVEAQLRSVERELDQLRESHSDLRQREAERDRALAAHSRAEQDRRRLVGRHDEKALVVARLLSSIERWQADIDGAPTVPEGVSAALDSRLLRLAVPEERAEVAMRAEFRDVAEAIQRRTAKAERAAATAMAEYGRGWQNQAADWGDTVDYLPEYLQRLEDLESDRLPEFEERFFSLLQSQARNNVSQLAMMIRGARREIRSRVDEVNKSLLMTAFSPTGFLQIEVRDRSLPDVDAFLATLNAITSGSVMDSVAAGSPQEREAAEARFVLMQGLLQRLGSADAADRAWRERCLDTRQHVAFQARVMDADGVQLDVFTGSGGRSGGERQKLVTFCLAAALRFQLAPPGRTEPTYALVVIDEAFDKADHTFTQAGLEVFRSFGFQLLLATPMKMLQTIDDYVGGVVMVTNEPGRGSALQELHYDVDAPIAGSEGAQEVLL
ncbi:ATP-binding protein [Tessaracoccus sp. Y1736]